MTAQATAAYVAATASVLGSTACADPTDRPVEESTAVATTTPTTAGVDDFDPDGCPVADPDACAVAARVAVALIGADAETIIELSRPHEFRCDETTDLPVVGCSPGAVLVGHPMVDAQPTIEVLDQEEHGRRVTQMLADVDPVRRDDHGDGSMRVLGIGTCGPDAPERRSYHVVFTAGVRAGSATDRVLGSYELNLLDGEWRIGSAFFDTYDAWLATYADPLHEHGCRPRPWRAP